MGTFSLSLLFVLAIGVPGAVLLAEPNGFDIRFVSLNGFDNLFWRSSLDMPAPAMRCVDELVLAKGVDTSICELFCDAKGL